MKDIKFKISLLLLLMASALMAQNTEGVKDTTVPEQRHYTPSSPDLPDQFKQYIELSKKYPNKSVWVAEDFGEQLGDLPKEELLRRLAISKDKMELHKIAIVLGDRELAGTLKLTDSETDIVDRVVRSYIRATADFDNVDHTEVHLQMIRFWQLAIPELLRNLENPNPYIQTFVFNTLVQLRNKSVVRIMINKAKACKSGNLKNMYIGTLQIMTQQENSGIYNRQTMNEKDSQELFDTLVAPALKELSPEVDKTVKN